MMLDALTIALCVAAPMAAAIAIGAGRTWLFDANHFDDLP